MNSSKIWRVHIPKRVAKSIGKLPQSDRERMMETLREFTHDPWSGDIVKIKGDENRQEIALVEITEIERRTSNTY